MTSDFLLLLPASVKLDGVRDVADTNSSVDIRVTTVVHV